MAIKDFLRRALGVDNGAELEQLRSEVAMLNLRLSSARQKQRESGVPFIGGPEGGSFEYEANSELKGHEKWKTLASMQNDAHVAASIRAIELPLTAACWEVKAASDSPRDVEIKEFVEANLLRTPSDKFGREYWSATPWKAQRLPEILDFLGYGFSMFAKTWKLADGEAGPRQVYDRLIWLEPSTVDPRGWVLDGDQLVAVKRTYRSTSGEFVLRDPIDAAEIALYPWSLRGARFEGTPFVRSMYGAWKRKDWLLKQAMIWAQKAGAPAPFGVYPAKWEAPQIAVFQQFLQYMRGSAPVESYGAFPMSVDGQVPEVKFAGADAKEIDRMRGLINGENAEIAHSGSTKSQLAGETASGSRAVAGTHQDFELLLIQAIGEIVCEFENFGAGTLTGVIEDLVERNYPGVKAYPILTVSKVEPQADLISFDRLVEAKKVGLVPDHPDLRRQVTERLGYTLPDDAYAATPASVSGPPAAAGSTGSDPNKTGDGGGGAPADPDAPKADVAASEDARQARAITLRLSIETMLRSPVGTMEEAASKGYGRQPTAFESQCVAIGNVAGALRDGSEQISGTLRRVRSKMLEDILGRIESGKVNRDTLGGLRRSRPKGEGQMRQAVRERFMDSARVARGHAQDELSRQADLARGVLTGQRAAFELAFAQADDPSTAPKGAPLPITGRSGLPGDVTIEKLVQELAGEARVASEIAVDEIWASLLDEAIAEYNRAIRSGMTSEQALVQVEKFLQGLSPATTDLAGRQIAEVAYNQGRDLAAKEAALAGTAEWAVRSEVLDQRTCTSCAQLDGIAVRIGTPEYEQLMPPARCQGGDNCRGFYVVVNSDLVKALEAQSAGVR